MPRQENGRERRLKGGHVHRGTLSITDLASFLFFLDIFFLFLVSQSSRKCDISMDVISIFKS